VVRKNFLEDLDLVKKAAYLASTGIKNKAISAQLGPDAVAISRLLNRARELGILADSPAFLINGAERRRIENLLYGNSNVLKQLREKFKKGQLSDLIVIDDRENREEVFNIIATYLLSEVLSEGRFIGLAWGPTVRSVVLAISRLMAQNYTPKEKYDGCEIVQTCGDPRTAVRQPELRSSSLVAILNASLTNTIHSKHTFNVSASIPKKFDEDQLATIQKYISDTVGYSEVFKQLGTRNSLRKGRLKIALNTLVTSCGSGQLGNDSWIKDCAIEQKILPKKLAGLVAGNIGGIWLPKDGLDKGGLNELEEINNRWTGMNIEDLRNINSCSAGGVVCIALESFKFDVVMELLTKGLVSRLILGGKK
jgi:DNA-binding transcriptional regulator LsrR (DeoR family)